MIKRMILNDTAYLEKLLSSPDIPEIKVDSVFTDPVVQHGRTKHRFQGMERREILQSYADVDKDSLRTFKDIQRTEQLFMGEDETPNHQRILLTGPAGIGKTLFLQKLARDWASDRLFTSERYKNRFKFVFFFTFRRLNLIKTCLSLLDFLNCAIFSPELDQDTFKLICDNASSVLLMFDGYDEYNHCIEAKDIDERPTKMKMSVAALIAKLAKGKRLSGATIILSTRPNTSEQLQEVIKPLNCSAEILGFSPAKVEQYITNFFEGSDDFKDIVLTHIQDNENLLGFCYIPVSCLIMYSSFKWHLENLGPGLLLEYKLPSTVTQLYQGVLDMFVQKHHPEYRGQAFTSKPEFSETVQRMLDKLSKVAFELLQDYKYVFTDSDLCGYGLNKIKPRNRLVVVLFTACLVAELVHLRLSLTSVLFI